MAFHTNIYGNSILISGKQDEIHTEAHILK